MRLKAKDLERLAQIERAGQMFLMHAIGAFRTYFMGWREITHNNKKVMSFLVCGMWGTQRSVLLAWCEIAHRYKRSRIMLANHSAVIGQIELANQKPQGYFVRERVETPSHSIRHFLRSPSSPASKWRMY